MASVFLYHVIGDLTVGKPELAEFAETETVESAIKAIGESTECGIPVWRKKSAAVAERAEMRQQRFVGILNSLDIVGFLCREECLADRAMAMKTPVAEVVVPNNSLLKELDPATRLIDALEMMRHGVKRLLVPKVVVWRGMSKRFSILYNGRWLKNIPTSPNPNQPSSSSSSSSNRFCCLSREDVIRFVIGCLGALAPLPLSSVSALGAINPNYPSLEASRPAVDAATLAAALDPCAVAVVEPTADGYSKIAGEISATKLWKCDYSAAAWALANLSAGQFVMGVEDDNAAPSKSLPDFASANPPVLGSTSRMRKFSSKSIGFFDNNNNNNNINKNSYPAARSMYRGRTAPLTCRATSSLAAVMAQMLSHRATHVWVTEAENEERLVGVIGYADVLAAVTRAPLPPTGFITVVPEKQAF